MSDVCSSFVFVESRCMCRVDIEETASSAYTFDSEW